MMYCLWNSCHMALDPNRMQCSSPCSGSRHSATGWRGGNLICFPVSHIYFFVSWGAKVYSQTGSATGVCCYIYDQCLAHLRAEILPTPCHITPPHLPYVIVFVFVTTFLNVVCFCRQFIHQKRHKGSGSSSSNINRGRS